MGKRVGMEVAIAAAEAVALCNIDVAAVYPITPDEVLGVAAPLCEHGVFCRFGHPLDFFQCIGLCLLFLDGVYLFGLEVLIDRQGCGLKTSVAGGKTENAHDYDEKDVFCASHGSLEHRIYH